MDNVIYDGIEWQIGFQTTISSGDEPGEWVHEFEATGVDENGNELYGIAYYTERFFGLSFNYISYDEIEEDDEWEDEEC